MNLPAPSGKAKYVSATDSVEYREGKVKSSLNKALKEYLKPNTYKQWEPFFLGDCVPFA